MSEQDPFAKKVNDAFASAFGVGADEIWPSAHARETKTLLASVLKDEFGDDAEDIAFHLSDWAFDGAFLTLLHLKPEIFTKEEIEKGLRQFLIHAPNHIAAAAKQSGNAIQDIFNVNALDGIHQLD